MPVDALWRYIEDASHDQAHNTVGNFEVDPITVNSFLITNEQHANGKWVKVASRPTVLSPLGAAVGCVVGPLVGSRFVFLYPPKGTKTEVALIVDFSSKTIPETQLKERGHDLFENAFEEDTAALQAISQRA